MVNVSTLRWKMNQVNMYRSYGFFEYGLIDILQETLSKKKRSENRKRFIKKYLEKMIFEQYGIQFDEATPFATLREMFEEGIYLKFDEFIPGKDETVLDVGAQGGDYSLLCSNYHGCNRVIAIEPLMDNFRTLLSNISLNAADNVIPILAAASDRKGTLTIGRSRDMAVSHGGSSTEEVQMVRIDDLGLGRIDIIKIDVEGFELEVIKGAKETIRKYRPRIILETHSRSLKESCLDMLSGLGYSLEHEGREIVPRKPQPMDSIQNLFLLPGPWNKGEELDPIPA